MSDAARFTILGPVEVWSAGRLVPIPAAKQRILLAVLVLRAGKVVSAEELIDLLWAECPPASPRVGLQTNVLRLRRRLGGLGQRIVTKPPGYLIEVGPDEVDVHEATRLAAEAEHAAEQGDLDSEARLLARALGLWRGEALADIDVPSLQATEGQLIGEWRLRLQQRHLSALLSVGKHAETIGPLSVLVSGNPLREEFISLLMLALHRTGRSAEALQHYEQTRRTLAEELGADPSPELRNLHERILAGDPGLNLVGAAGQVEVATTPGPARHGEVRVPRQLPTVPRSFVGRVRELSALDAALAQGNGLAAISGIGGVGKTWLALRWARQNAARFPDGQLYVDLRGFDPSGPPLPSESALHGLLESLGVERARIPSGADTRAAVYRSLVADRRMVIVLDNARDSAQVAPLLPGGESCVVLITGRHRMGGLVARHGAVPLVVDTLAGDEARQLLTGCLGVRRVSAERESVAELVRRCAGLPFALSVVAARATTNPGLPLRSLAEELKERSTRLDAIDSGDTATNLRAVFSCSYDALSATAVRLLGLLSLAPGQASSVRAAQCLAGTSSIRKVLRELEDGSLLHQDGAGRYQMHGLLRLYAAERATADIDAADRVSAVNRLAEFYLSAAYATDGPSSAGPAVVAWLATRPTEGGAAGQARHNGVAGLGIRCRPVPR
ncbi:BTAD domain-containing putative transcriptional regulator [Amycolatopsis sp. MJM2582]|uniref:AfsR/SARP family transcriptional regulator n=1 Tax=Amycolatopsis sp. MJM2582 TaxID=1427749 RepID=UPI0009DD7B44|nr:BTAD domain-containing putative transcriptional regulator [Amycolatopsis sp. MJM2582]